MSLHGTRIEKMMQEDKENGTFRLHHSVSGKEYLWIAEKSLKDLTPFYGYCTVNVSPQGVKRGYIYLGKELPFPARQFLYDHEFHHFDNISGGTWKSELAANWYAFKRHPWGAIQNFWMTLKSGRFIEYIKDLNSRKS